MNSKSTVLAVVIFLGLVALFTVTGGFVLAYNGKAIPGELIGLGSVAVGAIAGILSKTNTEPAVVDAAGNIVAAQPLPPAPEPAAPAAPPVDLTEAKAALAHAAAALEAAAPAAVEAVLADDAEPAPAPAP